MKNPEFYQESRQSTGLLSAPSFPFLCERFSGLTDYLTDYNLRCLLSGFLGIFPGTFAVFFGKIIHFFQNCDNFALFLQIGGSIFLLIVIFPVFPHFNCIRIIRIELMRHLD